MYQMDVQSAFLYGEISDDIYMSFLGENKNNSNTVCKLNKSIYYYGLKKSPKCWNTKFDSLMKEKGFVRSENDFCLYSKILSVSKTYILLYVDDVLLLGTHLTEVKKIKDILNKNFSMKDLGQIS